MFIGREREVRSLEVLYASGKVEFAVVYGRRLSRVGLDEDFQHVVGGHRRWVGAVEPVLGSRSFTVAPLPPPCWLSIFYEGRA